MKKIKTDYFLKDKNCSSFIKSISAFHVVKIHSLFIKKKFKISELILKILIRTFSFFSYFHKFFQYKYEKNIKKSKKKVLIISHLINSNHLNSKSDFYFGKLEKILKKMDKSCFKVMINHTKYNSSYLNSINKQKNSIVLEKNLCLKNELQIIIRKIKSVFELLILLLKNKLDYKQFFLLSISLFDSTTSFSIRINYLIKDYIRKYEPDYCLLTCEGYSWERMCINGIKSVNPKIKCIGYQHTPITKNHRAIFNQIQGNFNFDKIWCSQIKSYKILKEKIYKQIKKEIFFIGNLNKTKKNMINQKKRNLILVIPEGIYSECKNLFNFSLNLAKKYKKLNFVWRVHPVIDFEKVLKILKLKRISIPNNIKLSSKKFDEDVRKSKYVLYKGSAAVIKSVLMGNYPIYLKSKNEKLFDPLLEFFNKKNHINNARDFLKLYNQIENNKFKKKIKKTILILNKNFFSYPNYNIIRKHLSS
jgi:hypothetical protein